MFLTNKNDLLYDSKNFEKYNNIYCVLLNKQKIKYNENILSQSDNKLHHIYFGETLKLFFIVEKYISRVGYYKIIFGHYYNNENTFLYKDVKSNKIISYNIKKCKNNELLYKNNKLVCSNSYDILKKQITYIDQKETEENKEILSPFEITYNKEEKILNINSNGIVNISFSNGCLSINNK